MPFTPVSVRPCAAVHPTGNRLTHYTCYTCVTANRQTMIERFDVTYAEYDATKRAKSSIEYGWLVESRSG